MPVHYLDVMGMTDDDLGHDVDYCDCGYDSFHDHVGYHWSCTLTDYCCDEVIVIVIGRSGVDGAAADGENPLQLVPRLLAAMDGQTFIY